MVSPGTAEVALSEAWHSISMPHLLLQANDRRRKQALPQLGTSHAGGMGQLMRIWQPELRHVRHLKRTTFFQCLTLTIKIKLYF